MCRETLQGRDAQIYSVKQLLAIIPKCYKFKLSCAHHPEEMPERLCWSEEDRKERAVPCP